MILTLLCILGVTSTAAVAVPAATTDHVDASTPIQEQTQTPTHPTMVEFEQELRLVYERPGEIAVVHRYSMGANATEMDVGLPLTAIATQTAGFEQTGAQTYSWDGITDNPQLRYRISANQTASRSGGTLDDDGRLVFADTGEWALVRQPPSTHQLSGTTADDSMQLVERSIAEDGVTGTDMAYLGEYEKFTHSAHNQTFRLIVPENASLEATPAEIFETVSYSAGELAVGAADETVLLIAAPTDSVPWASRGVQSGPADMWVQDTEPVAVPRNVWVHEYIHTRQAYEAEQDIEWFTEATATYYAALFTYEQGDISFSAFQRELQQGESDRYEDAVLSTQDTWEHRPDYTVGPLVIGEIDRELRAETNNTITVQSVFRTLNQHDGPVNEHIFLDAIRSEGTGAIADNAHRYTTTTDRPSMWSSETHIDVFEAEPDSRLVAADHKHDTTSTEDVNSTTQRVDTQSSSQTIVASRLETDGETVSGVVPIALLAIGIIGIWRRYV